MDQVHHHHNYHSIDSSVKINFNLCLDSTPGKKVHGDKTKSEAIVENVFALKSIELTLLSYGSTLLILPVSLASDASNKGN
jgi:hypothetical protein